MFTNALTIKLLLPEACVTFDESLHWLLINVTPAEDHILCLEFCLHKFMYHMYVWCLW